MGNKLFGPFLWVVIACGLLAFVSSALQIGFALFDPPFVGLVAAALLLMLGMTMPLHRFSSQISVYDTFVFLILLRYGGAAAVVVGAMEAFIPSLRFSRRPVIVGFNWASTAVSILMTSSVLEWIFGSVVLLRTKPISPTFFAAICTMALTHYVSNSGIV